MTNIPQPASPDAPIFDPAEWHLTDKQAQLCAETRALGQASFADRAAHFDREAVFPTENYRDLATQNLLSICIPEDQGGRGADLKTYMLAAAEIGRYCGATALTFNMHVSSCLWTSFLMDNLEMRDEERVALEERRAIHYRRIVDEGKIYAQPFSEGGAAAAGAKAFGTQALKTDGGWIINGKKIFASLSGHADYYGALCTELQAKDEIPSRKNTMYVAVPADADGVSVEGDWDPLGMRGTISRTLIFQGCVRGRRGIADPARHLFQCSQAMAPHVHDPHPHLYGYSAGSLRFHGTIPAW